MIGAFLQRMRCIVTGAVPWITCELFIQVHDHTLRLGTPCPFRAWMPWGRLRCDLGNLGGSAMRDTAHTAAEGPTRCRVGLTCHRWTSPSPPPRLTTAWLPSTTRSRWCRSVESHTHRRGVPVPETRFTTSSSPGCPWYGTRGAGREVRRTHGPGKSPDTGRGPHRTRASPPATRRPTTTGTGPRPELGRPVQLRSGTAAGT